MLKINWDPDLDAIIQNFEEKTVAAQVRSDSLHPIDKEVARDTLHQQIVTFYNDLQAGYDVLVQTALDLSVSKGLGGRPPANGRFLRSIRHLFPSPEAVQILSDERQMQDLLQQGRPLFQVFGLSSEGVGTMYEVARFLISEERNEEARAAFRLLLVLAPHIGDFWVGQGVALLRLGRSLEAIESLEQACALDPDSVQSILFLCRALASADRRGEAEARLNARMDEAARRGDTAAYEVLESARFELSRFAK